MEPEELLLVHPDAFGLKQDAEPPIAKTSPLSRQATQTLAQVRRRPVRASGARSWDRHGPARRPAAGHQAKRGLPARRGRDQFSQKIVQRRDIQRRFRQELLQPAVLVFQRFERLRVRHLHPAVLRLPAVERLLADPRPPANLRRRTARLLFAQNPDDPRLAEPARPHVRLLASTDSHSMRGISWGRGQLSTVRERKFTNQTLDLASRAAARPRRGYELAETDGPSSPYP